jgi:AraC-like DNA-binding protein
MIGTDQFFSNQNMKLLCRDENCSVYQMKNKTGEGTATYYQVFPGIFVLYNDFHMENCPGRKILDSHIIEINHCREGRIEGEVAEGLYLYLAPGDILIDSFTEGSRYWSFPLKHYHGVTVCISVPEAMEKLADLFHLFSIDLLQVEQLFISEQRPFIMRDDPSPEHIFSELYQVPDSIRSEYLKVKVLELLVALKAVDVSRFGEERPYFYKSQVEKVKTIMAFMTARPDQHYTIEELSSMFDISVSSFKKCFKGVYGTAIFTYMRNFRIDMAATLLTQTEESITAIAGRVGYANSSKFSEAFKSVKGKTPLEYRKVKI